MSVRNAQFGSIVLSLVVFMLPICAGAQEAQILSVTPPLFQISVVPGDVWQSSVKVVNGNSYELTVFTEIVNFAPEGESGQGRFIPLLEGDDSGATLASWFEMARGPYTIAPEQSRDVQFFIEVPEDASPGGHFAAILVSTQPPEIDDALAVLTSQTVTSLFFLRIEGDVIEEGNIREFYVDDAFLESPKAEFLLRFENKGNVHLQPKGDIVITNMWGKERGRVPVNYQTHFGNVLPESKREFVFSWEGEASITEIGRHKAIATLTYGENEAKQTSAATYFWVIPLKSTLITLGLIAAFVLFIIWAVRMYVRRMLLLAGVDVRDTKVEAAPTGVAEGDITISKYRKVSAPIRLGALDLRKRLSGVREFVDVIQTLTEFIRTYRTFFIAMLIVIVAFVLLSIYAASVSQDQKGYEITIDYGDTTTKMNSEEIIKEDLVPPEYVRDVNEEQHFELVLINESGEPGVAAEESIVLENAGYKVSALETSLGVTREQTVIQYSESLEEEARALTALYRDAVLQEVQNLGDAPSVKVLFGTVR